MIVTKQQLLAKMAELCACRPATKYVTCHPSDDAAQIWADCPQVTWLDWLTGKLNPTLGHRLWRETAPLNNEGACTVYREAWPEIACALDPQAYVFYYGGPRG